MKRFALIAASLWASSAMLPAQAGGVGSLLDSHSQVREVRADDVLEAASGSFEDHLERALGLTPGARAETLPGADEIARDRREEIGRAALGRFREDARVKLLELHGDGVLLLREASDSLGDLRESHLDEIEETVSALASGHAPPPRRETYSSSWEHTSALLRYVLVERNAWWDWLILLGAAVLGLVLSGAALRFSKAKLDEEGGGHWKGWLHTGVSTLDGPLYLFFLTGGLALGLRSIWLPSPVFEPIWISLLTLTILALFWASWRLVGSITRRVGNWATPAGQSPGEQVLEIARKTVRIGLILLFLFLGLELVLDTDLTALLAGLGIAGIAVTLAAQDTLKDLFAAITIHANRPFALGDLVRYEDYFGTIEEIGFRMTRIRTLDGHLVTVPNSKLVGDPVENVGARPHVRRRFHLDLPYDTPVEGVSQAVELVREVIQEAGELDPDREVQVHFDEFGPHSLKLLVQYYYESGDYWASKDKATEIDLALVERFREEGLEFAFPTQTLHLVHEEEPVAES